MIGLRTAGNWSLGLQQNVASLGLQLKQYTTGALRIAPVQLTLVRARYELLGQFEPLQAWKLTALISYNSSSV